MPDTEPRLDYGIVVVTYNRASLLTRLFESLLLLEDAPARIIVVDNASVDETPAVVAEYAARFPEGTLIDLRQSTNTGGSGGFSAGLAEAYRQGVPWIWIMDDDVEVEPDAIARLAPWTERFRAVQGARLETDGRPVAWRAMFDPKHGVTTSAPGEPLPGGGELINTLCFEGALVHRDLVGAIGLPDARFFISWDDILYGWLASRIADIVQIPDVVLRRTRVMARTRVAGRSASRTSDMVRFHVVRNRAYIARYLEELGELDRPAFALGGVITVGKELARLMLVDRSPGGVRAVMRGILHGARIRRDPAWASMRPLTEE